MDRLTENKIILITRRTRLDELITRFNTADQARFYIEHLGTDFSDYQDEDSLYKSHVREAQKLISTCGRLQVLDRAYVPNFIFGKKDTIVVLGQDGLVANVLKYLNGQPVIGINPDENRWEGVLLPFTVSDLPRILPEVFNNICSIQDVTIAQVSLNTGQTLLGVNDLFIGQKTHTSARYTIRFTDSTEHHSSSGIIVSTGLGSTGWLRSILAGAQGIAKSISGKESKHETDTSFPWDSNHLYFSVREPWPSKTTSAGITFGKITEENPLELISNMSENGVIFSDGIESDCVEFNSGIQARIGIADKKGRLVVG